MYEVIYGVSERTPVLFKVFLLLVLEESYIISLAEITFLVGH
jgi:hypothetical protein